MKFPSEEGTIITIHADQKTARECYFASLRIQPTPKPTRDVNVIADTPRQTAIEGLELDPRVEAEDRVEPIETTTLFQLGKDEEQVTFLSSQLSVADARDIQKVLREYSDLFAWTAADMPGIDPDFHCHRLSVCRDARPIAQKKRKMGGERAQAIKEETTKLLQAKFIREVKYSTWLANVVMVKKPNGKWRMCTDYTDLNKACPKDAYPLPHIDTLVDGAAGHQRLSFLDAYSGYNQIPMYPPDEEKTAFITDSTNFCYRVMPFGLRNAGATYQRLMDKIFRRQIGTCLEVYVDDMVIKSNTAEDHLKDLRTIFSEIRRHRMRLNPAKCTFGVAGGKFLGFMLSQRGIEANPDKCQAIINMKSPSSVKEVQRLAGRIASLARFLPCMADKSRPIMSLLKKATKFKWNEECEAAFQSFKTMLATPPLLAKPDPRLDMIIYLSASDKAISTVLVQEKAEMQPVYFISRALQEAESRYQYLEKTVLALVHTARRLRHYFQSHKILVRTDSPIVKVLRKPELAGRMVAWSIELSQFDVRFEPRGPIKAQSMTDFVNEFTPSIIPEPPIWKLHVDGSSNKQGSGAGIILEGPGKMVIEQSLQFGFKASNNQAEYEALLAGLRLAADLGITKVQCFSDSQVVTEQVNVNGNFQIKEPTLLLYFHAFQKLKNGFETVQVNHTPREHNTRADRLAKLASSKKTSHLRSMIQQELPSPSVDETECMQIDQGNPCWMDPIVNHLQTGELPEDPLKAKRIRITAARYILIAGELYKRGISSPLLKCLAPEQAHYVLREIHEGICGTHSGSRTLAAKVVRAGYYWPTMVADCAEFVQQCKPCQQFGPITHQPPEELHSITVPWPFSIWGMDILGPFPPAKAQVKFLIVAVDHFTKWIEAEAVATITASNVQRFFWKNVITRFGIPYALITDNGLQFTDRRFNDFLSGLGIKHKMTSVEHPQSNGQAEAANKVILKELKRRLAMTKGSWPDHLPEILWAYRCTPQSSTKETPFRLAYGTDAMIPVEVGEPSLRRQQFNEATNREALNIELDMIDEIRERALVNMEACRTRAARKIRTKIKPRRFLPGDLVWRVTGEARKDKAQGKLAPNWDGPYRIQHSLQNGAYKLEELNGKTIPRTWNATHLKHYFS
uniref:Retrovirus-related Pol polyprotein from transposon 297 family n=1 Tax=Cajanus cajan TaxID=3821 RepID=A0A151TP75_CAJCA|nr:Retrovirus-related Pol polyprotein from transposon 297 family [Cajanus cajan]